MNYNVTLNGNPLSVFTEESFCKPYNNKTEIELVSFIHDFKEEAVLEITSSIEVKSAIIRPLSAGIKPQIVNGKIIIKLNRPIKFSLEINESFKDNLIVFAEQEKYSDFDVNKSGVIYIPAGNHDIDIINITENNTVLYIEEGAVVTGRVYAENCENIKICGYGKLTMRNLECSAIRHNLIYVYHCRNVEIEDVMLTTGNTWNCKISGCDNVNINNIKIIGSRGNSDGVDVCGSRNVTVSNIFTRTWDDSFVVKAFDTGDCENVTFKDSVLWNDFARPIEVGVELRADNVRNITFDNIDIIHSTTGYPLIGIHHGDRAKVQNITFSNIRIEDTPGAQLFDIRITNSVWNEDTVMGDIENIHFKNISYVGKPGMEYALSKSRLQGYDENHTIRNITLENINLLGKTASNAEECGLIVMDFVDNVKFICPDNSEKINLISSKIDISKELVINDNGLYEGKVKVTLENKSNVTHKSKIFLQASPINTVYIPDNNFSFELAPDEYAEHEFDVALPAGKYVLQVQSDDININGDWMFVDLDLVINKNANEKELYSYNFRNYYNTETDSIKIGIKENNLLLYTDILKDKENKIVVYAAMPVEDCYNQVKFTVEETDFGEAPAITLGRHGLELAPQLRCPAEITYVFNNEPKVKEIRKVEISGGNGNFVTIPFDQLGIEGNNFWLEIQADIPQTKQYRYPFTLFHSVAPNSIAHMFANVIVK